MHRFAPDQALSTSRSRLFVKLFKIIGPLLLLVSLVFAGGWWLTVHASQQGVGDARVLADSGGIAGYVVGNGPIAAYTCPDTVKCAVKLTLNPGTVVLIMDNVVGGNVPGLNDNAWRKITYQGLTLYVPMAYIDVGVPGNASGISLVQTSFEDDSTSSPDSSSTV